MILTCPACDTKYVVKDGAIPPGGRKVRCASCKHSWHQDADPAADQPDDEQLPNPLQASAIGGPPEPDPEAVMAPSEPGPHEIADQFVAEVPKPEMESPGWRDPEPAPYETPAVEEATYEIVEPSAATEAYASPDLQQAEAESFSEISNEEGRFTTPQFDKPEPLNNGDDDYVGYVDVADDEVRKRSKWPWFLGFLLLLAAAAAAFWFLAPPEWKDRAGIAQTGGSPLQLVITSKPDRQLLSSGNELVSVSGKVTNPTDKDVEVPPIQATLRNSGTKQVVHRWTIAPPAKILAPGSSASFNSAEVDIPTGGDELTISWAG